jgi:SPX domain protein involved in polyphosphate accumulation
MYRYERKYYLPGTEFDFDHVKSLILTHPAVFREAFYPRTINNIYMDTPGFDFFYDNVNGEQLRKKIRIRWYDDTFSFQKKLTLEYKLKNGLLGDKKSYPLSNIHTGTGFTIGQMKQELKANNLPLPVKNELLTTYPTLLNRYVREYFISDDQKFRITLDKDMTYYRIHSGMNDFNVCHHFKNDLILEIKYDPENENFINQISQHFPFRVTKSSKYVLGVQNLYGIV